MLGRYRYHKMSITVKDKMKARKAEYKEGGRRRKVGGLCRREPA